ncbi:MAG: type II toxin-antitoxin system VapC family toxin [Candidatus Nanoarchaeia archaeon]
MIFVDANIFLEVVLDDKKASSCINFFEKIKNKEIKAKTSDYLIYACLLQIQHKTKSTKNMEKFILFIHSLKGLEIIRPSLKDMYDAIKISNKHSLDFDDGLVVSAMINNDIKTLISFDKHFDKVSIIERKEP